jgi:poly-gamma-glutamate capsule biosynthesis protein CapA/YwtB (metallophosphatase superfamily)
MIEIFACGDIISKTDNADFIDNSLKQIITDADFSICNFEAPVRSKGKPIMKAGPHHDQSQSTIEYLKSVGFNVFSIANNHIYDFGETGLENTINEFEKHDLTYVGAGMNFEDCYLSRILTKNGTKIGVIVKLLPK